MVGEIDNQAFLSLPHWHGSQRRIGITGGIASGKSSIGQFLKEIKNLPILDADIYAHEALAPGERSTMKVLKRYGKTVKDPIKKEKPTINRSALSNIIFTNSNERLWLEKLLHPIVKQRLEQELYAQRNAPKIVLIIPLLFEVQLTELCSEIWVVNCTETQQYKRLMKRDGLTNSDAKARIQAQWPLKQKLPLADVIIDNSGECQSWLKQVDNLC